MIVVDKKASVTSYGVVDEIKKLLGISKVGHAGTLDPFATGVLLVCTGRATKITRFLMELEKEYVGTIRLGSETETDDLTGKVTSSKEGFWIKREDVEREMSDFLGRILQHPPRVSALKQRGRRLYELARRGATFETEARQVVIHDLRMLAFRFPELDFLVKCSKGTYVRALARDIGKKLGCGAHLRALRRVKIGPFDVKEAITIERLKDMVETGRNEGCARSALSIDQALSFMPSYTLVEGAEHKVAHGHCPAPGELDRLEEEVPAGRKVRILSSRGELVAIGGAPDPGSKRLIKLEKVLANANE